MYIKTKLAVITTTIALATAFSAPTQAAIIPETQSAPTTPTDTSPIKAVEAASINFEKPEVTTTPEPEPSPVIEKVQEEAVVQEPVVQPKPVETVAPAPVAAAPVTAPAAAPVAVAPSNKGAAILSAAMGQIGVMQDCTMLVTNSLKSVGINFHDWPVGYFSLGTQVSAAEAQPGDLIYYANGGMGMAHIAVYAGNGQAVHGGWNGNQTIVFSANVGSGPVFIRVH